MKTKFLTSFAIMVLIVSGLSGQEGSGQQEWGIDFSGFVNAQVFFDTRQMVIAREGMFAQYPKKVLYDEDGNDINAKSSLNQLAMTTRLRGDISAPGAFNADLSGAVEGDFTGQSNTDNNGFRLREAWIKLQWKKSELMLGLFWHPFYVCEARPVTIGLNTGSPYHPFSRHNQVRFKQEAGNFDIVFVAAAQMDYANKGPENNLRSPRYQRNSAIPNFHLQLVYHPGKHILGSGIDYKVIRPRRQYLWEDNTLTAVDENLHSLAADIFVKFSFDPLTLKIQALWGQNMNEHLMLGGFIEKRIDSVSRIINYANTEIFSVWMDISTTGKMVRVAVFTGYSRNLGYNGQLTGSFWGTNNDILYTYRVSPRIQFHFDRLMLAGEFEYTAAAYGTPDDRGVIDESGTAGNLRILLAAFYFF